MAELQTGQPVEIVIHNGRLVTFDPQTEGAAALAIANGRIQAVGADARILALAGPQTRLVDAQGATVLPGFIDSHVHLFMGAAELDQLNIEGLTGAEALAPRLQAYARSRPADRLLVATGANYYMFDGRPATRQDLDAILPDRALAIFAGDRHTVWANTKALELAGILHGAEVAEGAEIVMAPDGTATGMLIEPDAYNLVARLATSGGREGLGMTGQDPVPPATAAEREADKMALERGMRHCARHGITTLHNMDGNLYQAELLAEMEAEGRLPCRIEIPLLIRNTDTLERIEDAVAMRERFNSDKVWCARIKMFMDGVGESHTALMIEPYPDRPNSCGLEIFPPARFADICRKADRAGLQISVHAVGDLAVRRVLDGYQAAREANGPRDSRHRIEHVESIAAVDIPRLASLQVVASMQPLHGPRGGWFPPAAPGRTFHDDQRTRLYAFGPIRANAAKTIFNTDWPIVPVAPMQTIQAAVVPVDVGPHFALWPQSLDIALASYIRDNAWVEFSEATKGRLSPGLLADVVVMDCDLHSLPPECLSQARAAMTICDGKITWDARASS